MDQFLLFFQKCIFHFSTNIYSFFSGGGGGGGGGSIIYDFYRHVYDYIWDLYPQGQQNNSENKSSMY